jgi:hypothetical protein
MLGGAGDFVASSISGFLTRVRALVYRHQAKRALLYAVAALGLVAIVLPIVGQLFGGSRATAMAALGIGGLVAAMILIGAIVVGLVAPRRLYARDAELARWVGTRHAPIASDLLS